MPEPTPDQATPELLRRFRAGDQAGYAALFARYQGPLRRFVEARTDAGLRRAVSADDLLQEVHLEAIRGLEAGAFTWRGELSFFFWLCGIARNRVAHHCRRLRREPPLVRPAGRRDTTSRDLLGALRGTGRSPAEAVSLREHLDLLALALDSLPDRRRRAVILRYFEGLDGREAAAALDTTPGAFRVLLSRALGQLREALDALLAEP